MREMYDEKGRLLPDEARLTRFGRFLRTTSLDELPGLWNVLCGQMSLVGPRPLLTEYLQAYSPEQARRHEIKPGITGWAQIHGRNGLSWEEKFRYDVWYVDNCSFWLDMRILMGTIGTIFSMQGVNKQGHATTDKFYDANEVPPLFDKSSADVLVLGAGGHANVIISLLRETGHGIAGVYDDDPSIVGTEIMGVKVRGRIVDLQTNSNAQAIIAVGSPYVRQALANKYAFDWITLVHPMSWVDPSSQIGPGSVVMAGAVVQASCRLGKHVIVNTCASVDHECVLADFAHICPGGRLAGAVTIGERSTLGTGAIAIPGVEIGADTTIGAGAVVTRSIPPGVTAVGQPARITVENLKLTQVA